MTPKFCYQKEREQILHRQKQQMPVTEGPRALGGADRVLRVGTEVWSLQRRTCQYRKQPKMVWERLAGPRS